jgi:SAM-dependent methyltransferase
MTRGSVNAIVDDLAAERMHAVATDVDEAPLPAPPRDVLLPGLTQTSRYAMLYDWYQRTPDLHAFVPDFHRLQLEYWIWTHRARLGAADVVIDVGVESPRRWIGVGYRTVGLDDQADVSADLCALPFAPQTVDAAIVTEVLEHCLDPVAAVRELFRVIRPGGLALVTSPFLWPWHGRRHYGDYWRFTAEGWRVLFRDWASIRVLACRWTDEGAALYDLLRRFECFGFASLTRAATGYFCEVTR